MFLLKDKFPKYYSYQGRKISKKLSLSNRNLIAQYFNQFSFDQKIIEHYYSKNSKKKIEVPKDYKKINIEIGFGDGEFLIKNAISKPNELFFGVEVYLNGVAKVLTSILSLNLKNIILSNLNSMYFLDSMPRRSINKIFIINPDPWIKKRHHKRRLMSYSMMKLLANTVKSKDSIYMTTDSELYISDTEELLNKHIDLFGDYTLSILSENDELYGISRYQRKAIKGGRKIYLLTFWNN